MVFLDELPAERDDEEDPCLPVVIKGEASRLEGNQAYKDGDLASAVALYTQSLEEARPPSSLAPVVLGNRSAAYLALGRRVEALRDAEESVRLSPGKTTYAAKSRFRMGNALVANGRLEDAREAYRGAIRYAPGDRSILAKLKETSEMILAADEGRDVASGSGSGEGEGGGAVGVGTEKEEEEEEQKEDEKPPPSSWSISSSSLSSLKPSISSSETITVPSIEDANRANREERYADALDLYNQVEASSYPSRRPERMHAFYGNRSNTLLALGRSEEAMEDARRCVALNPEYVKGVYRLGEALIARAEEEMKATTETRTGNCDDDSELLCSGGRRRREYFLLAVEARETFAKGLVLDPDSPEMKENFDRASVLVQSCSIEMKEEERNTHGGGDIKNETAVEDSSPREDEEDKNDIITSHGDDAEVDKDFSVADVTCGTPASSFMTASSSSVSSNISATSFSSSSKSAKKKRKKKQRAKAVAAAATAVAQTPESSSSPSSDGHGGDTNRDDNDGMAKSSTSSWQHDETTTAGVTSSGGGESSDEWVMVSPTCSSADDNDTPEEEEQTLSVINNNKNNNRRSIIIPPVVPFEALFCSSDNHNSHRATLRASVRRYGCVGVRLHPELSSSGVLKEACEAASAFFALNSAAKARHKPVGFSSRHGYRTPRDAARREMLRTCGGGGGNGGGGWVGDGGGREDNGCSGGILPGTVKEDEEHHECFVVGDEYEADYPWPEGDKRETPGVLHDFKRRVLDAHVTLRMTANKAVDALMSDLVDVMDDKFDEMADSIGLTHMFSRTTFVHHPSPEPMAVVDGNGKGDSEGKGESEGESPHSSPEMIDAAAIAAAAATVVGVERATPEPTLVTLIPCFCDAEKGGGGGAFGGTVTRLQHLGRPLIQWPPPPSSKSSNHDAVNHDDENDDNDDFRDVVLVVAGEWLSKITDGVYPAPAVSHERSTRTSPKVPCVHITYRS